MAIPTDPGADPRPAFDDPFPNLDPSSRPTLHVSPQLGFEVTALRMALAESLNGQAPLQPRHAQYLAGWVFNLMLDAAHQNAVDLGTEPNPSQAIAEVLQILEVSP